LGAPNGGGGSDLWNLGSSTGVMGANWEEELGLGPE
jgi:hypothetical protein